MKRILAMIFDLETTRLDTETCKILEIGWVLADLTNKKIITMESHLIKPLHPFKIEKEITELTGIEYFMLEEYGSLFSSVMEKIESLVDPFLGEGISFIAGHNIKNYDSKIFYRYIDNTASETFDPTFYTKIKNVPLIDTSSDLPIPKTIKTRKLTHLAYEHGIIMRPAHRALVDCLMTTELLFKYDIDEVLKYQSEEKIDLVAITGFPNSNGFKERKNEASQNGFRWNPDEKLWIKTVRVSELEDAKKINCPVKTREELLESYKKEEPQENMLGYTVIKQKPRNYSVVRK